MKQTVTRIMYTAMLMLILCAFSSAQEKKAIITVNVNKVIGEVNPWVFGSNMIGYQKGGWPHAAPDYADRSSGMWDPEKRCSVPEMVTLAKNAGLSVARYPGG